jgi:hypothetical protein
MGVQVGSAGGSYVLAVLNTADNTVLIGRACT